MRHGIVPKSGLDGSVTGSSERGKHFTLNAALVCAGQLPPSGSSGVEPQPATAPNAAATNTERRHDTLPF